MSRKRLSLADKIKEQAKTLERGLEIVASDCYSVFVYPKDEPPADTLANAESLVGDLETLLQQAQDLLTLVRERLKRSGHNAKGNEEERHHG